MSDSTTYSEIKQEALDLLSQNDAMAAFQTFRAVCCFGTSLLDGSDQQFADAFEVFAQIAKQLAGDDFAQLANEVGKNPNNVQALYDLGYALYEQGLFSIAALVLSRANELVPNEPAIVSELVCALEGENLSNAAVDVLNQNQKLTESDFTFAYLIGFNQFMSGDLEAARSSLTLMTRLAEIEDHHVMQQRIETFIQRADQVKSHSKLDEFDLRGWHYAINGSVLLELSPFGYPEPMCGRFAYLGVSYEAILHGIHQLKSFLKWKQIQLPCILALPDRNSLILSHAISNVFGCPLKMWPEKGTEEPGLIVSFDLSQSELSQCLSIHRHNQFLYSFLLNWTESCPIAPDIVNKLAQTAIEPWGPNMRINPETQEVEHTEADDRDPDLLAQEILAAKLDNWSLGTDDGEVPPPELSQAFADGLDDFTSRQGSREKYWVNSPVHSARFA